MHLIGQVLDGKYRIEKQLGRGGMGVVFLAIHLGTKRPVALKVIVQQLIANAESVERFKREAETAGRLRHPNIVNVTDFGFARIGAEQVAYLVMEYLDGQTLGELLGRERRLPLDFVVGIAEQVCLAIDKAHQQGIIHRDLKPDNIWLEPNGRGGYNVKVLDFGLAKLRDVAPAHSSSGHTAIGTPSAPTLTNPDRGAEDLTPAPTIRRGVTASDEPAALQPTTTPGENHMRAVVRQPARVSQSPSTDPGDPLTRAGAVLGTPLYMSPEQCRGKPLDPASDLYSLGVILYEMLAGETPFKGDASSLLRQHAEEPPPPLRAKRPDTPPSVAAQVMSALAKNPAERPPNAAAFAVALRANAAGESALLRQTITLYIEHFSTFIGISLLGSIPTTAGISGLFLGVLLPPWHIPIVIYSVTLLFLSGLFFHNAVIGGVVVPVTWQLLTAPLRPVRVRPLLAALKARSGALVTTSLLAHSSFLSFIIPVMLYAALPLGIRSGLYGSRIFWLALAASLTVSVWLIRKDQAAGKWMYAPVVSLEGLRGCAALARSKALVARLEGTMGTGRVMPLLVLALLCAALLATMLIWSLMQLSAKMDQTETIIFTITATFGILLSALLTILLNPLLAIAIALFYLKARLAGGEKLGGLLGESGEQNLSPGDW